MGCCGGKVIKQIKNVTVGYARLFANKIGLTKMSEFTVKRIRICHKCDESTWLTVEEYGKWLKDNGIEILGNFSQLETLPKLPKYKIDNKRRNIFCRICKCFVPAKARVPEAICPYPEGNKWALNELENDHK